MAAEADLNLPLQEIDLERIAVFLDQPALATVASDQEGGCRGG